MSPELQAATYLLAELLNHVPYGANDSADLAADEAGNFLKERGYEITKTSLSIEAKKV